MMNIHTVAAGGGSQLAFAGGRLTVGPGSAGSRPGPACYRNGGPLTVTDVQVLLGRIRPDAFPALFGPSGDEPLDAGVVRQRSRRSPRSTGDDGAGRRRAACGGIPRRRGRVDGAGDPPRVGPRGPRPGGVRAAVLRRRGAAARLPRRRCARHPRDPPPPARGRALGVRHRPRRPPAGAPPEPRAARSTPATACGARRRVRGDRTAASRGDVAPRARNRATSACAARSSCARRARKPRSQIAHAPLADVLRDFRAVFTRRFGFAPPAVRPAGRDAARRGRRRGRAPTPRRHGRAAARRTEPRARGLVRRLARGAAGRARRARAARTARGPGAGRRAEFDDRRRARLVAPSGWPTARSGSRDTSRGRRRRDRRGTPPIPRGSSSSTTASCRSRSRWAPCSRRRPSRSTSASGSISPARSSTRAGALIANAPHMPVHLGSMGASVRAVIAANAGELRPGRAWMLNAPYAGGTHLPDITVVRPVFVGRAPGTVFFVASRAHHADIGGITPGSMPPASRTIAEEGVVLDNFLLVDDGAIREAALRELPRRRAAGRRGTPTRTSPTSRRSSPRTRAAPPSSRRWSGARAATRSRATWRTSRTTPKPACARSSAGSATASCATRWTTAAPSRSGSASIARGERRPSTSPAPRRSSRATSTRRSRSAPRPCSTCSARWSTPSSR